MPVTDADVKMAKDIKSLAKVSQGWDLVLSERKVASLIAKYREEQSARAIALEALVVKLVKAIKSGAVRSINDEIVYCTPCKKLTNEAIAAARELGITTESKSDD